MKYLFSTRTSLLSLSCSSLLMALSACGGAEQESQENSMGCDASATPTRTISCVESFHPGQGSGFGMNDFPEIISGPPKGGGEQQGSLDVLSLGRSGEIVVGFGGNAIVDGDGADFLVFENAFYENGDATRPFKELGEISVSEDGTQWVTFPCNTESFPYEGCAGWHPVLAGSKDSTASSFDPQHAGGDSFDLATVGLSEARFVRIRDVSNFGAAPIAGFDLDAVAIVHARVE